MNERRNTLTRHGNLRSASTLNKEVGALRHMLNHAVENEMLQRNPFDMGKSLILKENNKRFRYLSEEELAALLPQCADHVRDIVEVTVFTGMRRGELLSLKWSQIAGDFIYLDETKTNEPRQIPISDDLRAVLRRIRQKQWRKGLKTEYILCDEEGWRYVRVPKGFLSALRRAGIKDFRFNDLRHTFASHYVMRGGSLKALQKILGDSKIEMTMRYAHLSKEFAREEIQIMNGLTGCHTSGTKSNQPSISL